MGRNEAKYRASESALWASVDLRPEERWITLPSGERVRANVLGNGPAVVFIHGGSSSGANWVPLLKPLNGFTCYIIDRPGCGLSDPVAGGSKVSDITDVEQFADRLLADVLDGLELTRSHVIATSLGGFFMFRGAAANPERVDRLVEITWPIGAPVHHAPMSMRLASIPGLEKITTKMPANRSSVKMILKQIGLGNALRNGRVSDEFLDWFVALLRHTDTMINELRANPKVITPLKGLNERMVFPDELLARVDSPVMFIWGGEDPMGGETVGREFAGKFADATFHVLPDAGHAPWVDEPEQCARWVSEFLAP